MRCLLVHTKSEARRDSLKYGGYYDELDRRNYVYNLLKNKHKKAFMLTIKKNCGPTAYCSDYYGILYNIFQRFEVYDFSYELDKKDRWHMHLIILVDKVPYWRSLLPKKGWHIKATPIYKLDGSLSYIKKDSLDSYALFQAQDSHWYRHNIYPLWKSA